MNRSIDRATAKSLGCGLLLVLLASSLFSQTSGTGALAVTVHDPSGAVLPGATVAVSNASGLTRTETTGPNGNCTFTLLPPGAYKVSISAPGFKSLEASAVTVDVAETRALNQTLEIGTQEQQVTVATNVETVQTETSTLGGVVNTRAIAELPLSTRNYTQILNLSPGVVAGVSDASAFGRGDQFIFANGHDDAANSYQIDGVQASSYPSGTTGDYIGFYGSIAIPSPDALQEFKVQTSLYDASYGRTAGANVNLVTKSGTNNWHATLFEFLRNDDLNANTFFRNAAGQPRGELKQNQFGGTAGGPIKRDKLFFFLSYQDTRQRNGVAYQGSAGVTLPAALTNNRTAAALGAAFCGSPTFSAVTGAANPAIDQVACDGSNINPVSLKLLNTKLADGSYFLPTPQTILNAGTKTAVGFSSFSIPAQFNENQIMFNLDYAISSKNTFSGKYFWSFAPSVNPFYGSGLTGQSAEPPGGGNIGYSGNQLFAGKLTTLLSPNLVNEARFSSYYIRAQLASTNPVTAASVGMTPSSSFNPILPVISIVGLLNFGGTPIDAVSSPSTTYEWSDQLSWTLGRHTLRMGYDENRVIWNVCSCGKTRGTLTFQTFSDFLLGESAAQNGTSLSNLFTSSANVQPFSQPNLLRENALSGFIADDFKVNQRLTLNLGLRWEYDGTAYDARPDGGTNAVYSLAQTVPIPAATGTYVGFTVANGFQPALPDGVVRRSTNLLTYGHAPLNNFAPRFGFAWQPLGSGRLVVRGGYGWFYNQPHGQQFLDTLDGEPPVAVPFTHSGATNATATLAVPFNPAPVLGTFNTFLRTPTSALSLVAEDPNLVTPLDMSWNLNTQYSITQSLVLEVGYIGNRAEHLVTGAAMDLPQLASPSNPLNCGGPTGCITTNTAANAAQRLPILGISPGGFRVGGNWGDSHYNALQVTLRKTLAHGLQFQGAYTYGKCINDVEGATLAGAGQGGDVNFDAGLQNRRIGRGECAFDRPQRLVVNYLYTLPSYHSARGFAGKVLSGWGASGVTTLQAGLPMTFLDTRGGQVYGAVGNSGAQLCPGMTYGNILTSGSVVSRLNNYFNASAFCAPPVVGAVNGVGGATGYGNTGPTILLGPPQFNWDISILKNTIVGGLREGANLQFRTEFFNAFNHPQFNNPATNVASASTFGVISSTSVGPRVIQFALKYAF